MRSFIHVRHPNGVEIQITAPDDYPYDIWQKALYYEAIISLIESYGDWNSSIVESGETASLRDGLLAIQNLAGELWEDMPF